MIFPFVTLAAAPARAPSIPAYMRCDSFIHDAFIHDAFIHDSFPHNSFITAAPARAPSISVYM